MHIRNHNVRHDENHQLEPEVPQYRPRPYKGKSEELTLVLTRNDVYCLMQLLQDMALESRSYDRVRLAVELVERIRQTANEHGY